MPRSSPSEIGGTNLAAVLDTLAWSELGAAILAGSDDGYNVFVGSTPNNINTFSSYADHPMKLVSWKNRKGETVYGSAAGRYQLLKRYWPAYKSLLHLPDFSPQSQDKVAIQMIKEQKAFIIFQQGKFTEGFKRISNIWASVPGAGYGQHEHELASLEQVYLRKGGVVTA